MTFSMSRQIEVMHILCFWALIFIATNRLVEGASSFESAPDNSQPSSSSFAMNSDGKGEVSVSCNGKTFKGEGMAACTSDAYKLGTHNIYLLELGLGLLIYTYGYRFLK